MTGHGARRPLGQAQGPRPGGAVQRGPHHERVAPTRRKPSAICYGATLSGATRSRARPARLRPEGRRPGGDHARGGQTTSSRRGSGRQRRLALLTPLLAAVSLALLAGPASAAPGASGDRPVTTSYQNPLAPDIPGDGTVDSCADPTVIKGQDGETLNGEQVWYMYCTTDPLNDQDVNDERRPGLPPNPDDGLHRPRELDLCRRRLPARRRRHPGLDRPERRVLGSRGRLLQHDRSVLPICHRDRDDGRGRWVRHLRWRQRHRRRGR